MSADAHALNTVNAQLRYALILRGYVMVALQPGSLLRAEMGLVHPTPPHIAQHRAWQEGRSAFTDGLSKCCDLIAFIGIEVLSPNFAPAPMGERAQH